MLRWKETLLSWWVLGVLLVAVIMGGLAGNLYLSMETVEALEAANRRAVQRGAFVEKDVKRLKGTLAEVQASLQENSRRARESRKRMRALLQELREARERAANIES